MSPHIKILILNWNGKELLKPCLESVLKIDYANYSVLVIDNGSRDNSLELVKENYNQVECLALDNNYGFSGGYNRSFEYLKNDPRCSWVIDDVQTMEKILCEGVAELVEESVVNGKWVGIAEKMAVRYHGPDGPTYLVPTLNQPRWLFRLRPTKLRSWQGVGWAKSYWVENTEGPTWKDAHNQA